MRKDFALCFNDGYVPFASVTIKSILDNMQTDDDVHIHIISDYISVSHQAFIKEIAFNVDVKFYIINADDEVLTDLPVMAWSIYAWYRILLPDLLDESIHRVLYLDCDVLVNDNLDECIAAYCGERDESEKIVKQRIRRAAKKGLRNMAHMGIEDSYSEVYQNYAQLVFDFENLRKEMDFLRETGDEEGKVNIYHFMEGLLIYNENR